MVLLATSGNIFIGFLRGRAQINSWHSAYLPMELRHGEKSRRLLHYMRSKLIMRVEYFRLGKEKLIEGGDYMLTLFLRAMILYVLVFLIIRLMGKRQISDLQPFDLVFTLLIADLASNPIGNTSVPLVYGIIPILALFLLQQLAAFLSLKSERARALLAGKPQIIIANGILQEEVMRSSYYTINDLMEQLRGKDVFDIGEVSYAIIETDGNLSVLLKGDKQPPTIADCKLPPHPDKPAQLVVLDGKIHERALSLYGHTVDWLTEQLKQMGFASPKQILFASLSPDGQLYAQSYQKNGGRTCTRKTGKPGGNA